MQPGQEAEHCKKLSCSTDPGRVECNGPSWKGWTILRQPESSGVEIEHVGSATFQKQTADRTQQVQHRTGQFLLQSIMAGKTCCVFYRRCVLLSSRLSERPGLCPAN